MAFQQGQDFKGEKYMEYMMSYYLILALPFALVLSRLLATNFIIPYRKKKILYNQLKESLEWPRIEKIEQILKQIFKGVHSKTTSIIYRNLRFITSKEFIYGEIDFLAFYTILLKANPQRGEIFYDLGSGAGKAVFTAGLFFDLSKSCGIELLPPLYKKATEQLKKITRVFQQSAPYCDQGYLKQIATIQFINTSFLTYDFSDADLVYVAATCLSDQTWEELVNRMADLKPGTRIIVATKNIQHKNFELIYQGVELMSWGLCPVTIYKIQG